MNDLPIKQGIFASATDYTAPAKKYANSTHINPSQKPINLLHIRPSTELDRKGRVERIIINITFKVLKQLFIQRLLHPAHDIAFAVSDKIGLDRRAAPAKIGRAPLAALLKNSRRD